MAQPNNASRLVAHLVGRAIVASVSALASEDLPSGRTFEDISSMGQ